VEVLPCTVCRPDLIWSWRPGQPDAAAVLLADGDLMVDLESPWPQVHRAPTPRGIVREIEGHRLSLPAKRILELAKQADPAIAAVYARPAAPPRTDAA
jgi:hypothetical protein